MDDLILKLRKQAGYLAAGNRVKHGGTVLDNHREQYLEWKAAERIEQFEAVLKEIAGQKNSEELKESGELYGDYEEGFDMCVMKARRVLASAGDSGQVPPKPECPPNIIFKETDLTVPGSGKGVLSREEFRQKHRDMYDGLASDE